MKANVDVIHVKRIRAGSLAALVFTGSAMVMIPMCVFFGILALFGAKTVHVNGACVTGIAGLLLALVYGPLFTGIFGVLAWPAAYVGIRLVGRFKPFRIEYVPAQEQTPNQMTDPAPDRGALTTGDAPPASSFADASAVAEAMADKPEDGPAGDRAAGSRGAPEQSPT
jgi:hypothetical protein